MDIFKFWIQNTKNFNAKNNRGEKGFTLVSMIILIPLVAAITMTLVLSLYVLKRKSLAQSICIQEAARLQDVLRKPLKELVGMNPQAEILRMKRDAANKSLQTAVSSGIPYAIIAAQAVKTAVILEQLAFRARQLALLSHARILRTRGQRTLHERARRMGAKDIRSRAYFHSALAVEPKPILSLTPNYEAVSQFDHFQQQRFQYQINLISGWPIPLERVYPDKSMWVQPTECSVTMKGEDDQWATRILAAKAQRSY